MLKILIAENIPSLNKGEMTILDGMLESFRILGEVEVSMLSARPEIDAPRYVSKVKVIDISESWPFNGGLDIGKWGKIPVSILIMFQHMAFALSCKIFGSGSLRLFKSNIWKEYLESDVIIEGHNGTFGIGGSLGIPYFYLLYLPLLAKVLGKPIVLYSGSVGSFGRDPLRLITKTFKFALMNIHLVTLRDRISYQNIKAIDLQRKCILVTGDLAYLLQPASSERGWEIMEREGIEKSSEQPLIGITVTRRVASIAFPQLDSTLASYHKHVRMLAEVVDSLTHSLGAMVVFIPHCIGFGEELDDKLVHEDIFQRCHNKQKVKLITNEYNAAELKCLIGQFDLFIGERLHSVINAMSMGVPSVIISNSTDQRLDMIRMLGQDDAVCFVENLDSSTLLAKINDIWSKRDKINDELKAQTTFMEEKSMLNGRLLKKLLESRTDHDSAGDMTLSEIQ